MGIVSYLLLVLIQLSCLFADGSDGLSEDLVQKLNNASITDEVSRLK